MSAAGSIADRTGGFFVMVLCILSGAAQSGLVTLQGRNFKVDGQDYFPKLVNYGIELTSPDSGSADTSALFITPEGAYDRNQSSHFECHDPTECDEQLLAHLAQVRSMGFNGIRLVGPFTALNLRDSTGQRFYGLNVHVNEPWGPVYRLHMDYPDFTGAVATKYFQLYRHMLDLCDSAGVKVLMLTGGRVGYEPPHPTDPWQDYTTADAEVYSVYLGRLAEELNGHPAVLAYDLWNEPVWGGDATADQTKQTVCEWTTLMYDSLKHYDPAHLITLGGSHVSELNSWDPMVMKLDFYAPHFYPLVEPFGNYDVAKANDQMRAEFYWLGKTCPMPWIIGETAFSADDDTTDHSVDPNWICLLPDPMFHKMPWMQGNEDQQVDFAFQSLDAVRNSQGSGYAWWDFQSSRTNPIYRLDTLGQMQLGQPLAVNGNWMSLLGFGNGVNPWKVKKVADTLDSYVLPPEAQALPPEPYNYRSWLGFESDSTHMWGWVKDQNDEPIADAVIEWGWRYNNDGWASLLTNPEESAWDRITPFWDGYFQVPKPPHQPPGWIRNDTIGGALLVAHGGMGYHQLETYTPGTVFEIERHLPLVNDTVPSGTLNIPDTARYRAYNDLFVHGQIVAGNGITGAVADYSARFNVHVTGEFQAQQGSDAHFFNEQVWPDCSSPSLRSASQAKPPRMSASEKKEDIKADKISLMFGLEPAELRVAPNPAQSTLTVTCTEPEGTFVVIDDQGRQCLLRAVTATITVLDVSHLAAGRYELEQRAKKWTHSKAFVIAH